MRMQVSRGAAFLVVGAAVLGIVGAWRRGGVTVLWEQLWPWMVVAVAAGLHELGHIMAAWGAGVGIGGLKLDLFGARLELRGMLSYGQEFFVAAGGPLASLFSAALAHPLAARGQECAALFYCVSLVLGGVNLLPVGTLDGGRILRSLTAWLFGERVSITILRVTTGICLGLLWMLAVYGLLRAGQMLSVFAFSLCLLVRSVTGKDGG